MSSAGERIAVTGVGIVSALGSDAPSTFSRLVEGERAVRPVTLFEVNGARAGLAAEVPFALPGPAALGSSDLELSRSDKLALLAATEALSGAGEQAARRGVSIGGTTGGMAFAEAQLFAENASSAGLSRARRLLSHPLSATAQALDAALGPFVRHSTVCTACSSGAVAIVQGVHWLLRRDVEQVLAGGVDGLCRMTFAGFDALGALDPEPCRPFDVTRKGLTLGEGAGFLLLELESRARARGAPVLCWLTGWAVGAEAHHVTHPEPSGQRAAELMAEALARGGLDASDLDYVNAHGTGTVANDAMEAKALASVLGEHASRVRVSSSKGQLGHTLGAAGAIEAGVTALALAGSVAPPTAGLRHPEVAGLRHVLERGEPAELRAALSSSFGFGGMNSVLLFEHAEAKPRAPTSLRQGWVVRAATAIGVELDASGQRAFANEEGKIEPLAALDAERTRRFDRGSAWVTLAVQRTLEGSRVEGQRVGLAVGNAYGAVERSLAFLDRLRERGQRFIPPAEFPQLVHSALAGNASVYLQLDGPVAGVAEGELSAPSALSRALAWLELGLVDRVVAGAFEARDAVIAGLAAHRDRGEGGGFLLLERESSGGATRRAAKSGASGELAPLARLVEHAEEREGTPPTWRPPRRVEAARLLLAPSVGSDLRELVRQSSWNGCSRISLATGSGAHEALAGSALALAASLVSRGVPEVLVVAGSASVRYVTRFEALEPFA